MKWNNNNEQKRTLELQLFCWVSFVHLQKYNSGTTDEIQILWGAFKIIFKIFIKKIKICIENSAL